MNPILQLLLLILNKLLNIFLLWLEMILWSYDPLLTIVDGDWGETPWMISSVCRPINFSKLWIRVALKCENWSLRGYSWISSIISHIHLKRLPWIRFTSFTNICVQEWQTVARTRYVYCVVRVDMISRTESRLTLHNLTITSLRHNFYLRIISLNVIHHGAPIHNTRVKFVSFKVYGLLCLFWSISLGHDLIWNGVFFPWEWNWILIFPQFCKLHIAFWRWADDAVLEANGYTTSILFKTLSCSSSFLWHFRHKTLTKPRSITSRAVEVVVFGFGDLYLFKTLGFQQLIIRRSLIIMLSFFEADSVISPHILNKIKTAKILHSVAVGRLRFQSFFMLLFYS